MKITSNIKKAIDNLKKNTSTEYMDKNYRDLTKKERRELRRQEKELEKLNEQKRMKQQKLFKRVVLWFSVILGLGGIVFGMVKFVGKSPPDQIASQAIAIPAAGWTKGNQDAKVVLVEYSDFQCPACRNHYFWVKRLTEEFHDRMQFIYRHFPLRQHANAELAARAAEAAGKQGKFWEMHDRIFETQNEWATLYSAEDTFIKYAQALNLSIQQFQNDLHSKEIKDKVANDFQDGIRAGVDATPTFFLNGKKILKHPRSYDEFRNIIKEATQSNS